MPDETPLTQAERGVRSCDALHTCNTACGSHLTLSQIPRGDPRRGSRDAKVILVTEAPDATSGGGSAFSGQVARRIRSYFSATKYGINLHEAGGSGDEFGEFLRANRMYATSAVKCVVDGGGQSISYDAIRRCRTRFLANQIEAHSRAEIIVPMGAVAASSILHKLPRSIRLNRLIGRTGAGVFREDPVYRKKVVVLPHPSGTSPQSNPPVPLPTDSLERAKEKKAFRYALTTLRAFLTEEGYQVGEPPGTLWEPNEPWF